MSVLKNKRKTAFSEFERQMLLLCRYTKDRLNTVPARYKKFVNPKIYNPTNKASTAVILANEQNPRTAQGQNRRLAMFKAAVQQLISLQKPLIAVWNLLDIEEDSAKRWADMVNREFALIWGVTKWEEETKPMIVALPKRKIGKLEFLKTMAELHRFTYTKIGHAPNHCKDTISDRIADFINTALCEIILANHKIPETKAEAAIRAAHIQSAIDNLNGLQRPLLALWVIQDYSENEMDEWAGLIDKELKLLEGLKAADAERYKNLK